MSVLAKDEFLATFTWQLKHLVELGFDIASAEAVLLAVSTWHDVAELIAKGATPEQAKRILL